MTARRFKDRLMQKLYEDCLRLGEDTTSEFYHQGRPRRGASHRIAYWNGRSAMWSRQHEQRNTLSYAAYAAGQDARKADVAAGNAMPTWTLEGNYMQPPPGWAPTGRPTSQ